MPDTMENKKKIDYASAGVNLQAADEALDKIKKLARATFNENVLSDIGSFGGLYKPPIEKFKNPVLVSSTDSVGTKLKLAFMTGIHNTVGQCIVNHCVNDILVQGAMPLFFMDYLGVGVVKPEVIAQMVEGLTFACRENNMPLLGGETAELPGFYQPGEYDLVGTIVGMVDRDKIVDGSTIKEGNIVYGLPSVGLHTNGYSLARKICFEIAKLQADSYVEEIKEKIGIELLKVHRSYLKPVTQLLNEIEIKGMAHITGGGIPGNLIRILPENLKAILDTDSWPNLPIFEYLQTNGGVADDDMFDAFNMGVGYIVVVDKSDADKTEKIFSNLNQEFYQIGEIVKGTREVVIK